MNWKSAFTSPQLYLASMVVDMLAQHGIKAILLNKGDSNYPIGWYEVHVQFTSLLEAKYYIKGITDPINPKLS